MFLHSRDIMIFVKLNKHVGYEDRKPELQPANQVGVTMAMLGSSPFALVVIN